MTSINPSLISLNDNVEFDQFLSQKTDFVLEETKQEKIIYLNLKITKVD